MWNSSKIAKNDEIRAYFSKNCTILWENGGPGFSTPRMCESQGGLTSSRATFSGFPNSDVVTLEYTVKNNKNHTSKYTPVICHFHYEELKIAIAVTIQKHCEKMLHTF